MSEDRVDIESQVATAVAAAQESRWMPDAPDSLPPPGKSHPSQGAPESPADQEPPKDAGQRQRDDKLVRQWYLHLQKVQQAKDPRSKLFLLQQDLGKMDQETRTRLAALARQIGARVEENIRRVRTDPDLAHLRSEENYAFFREGVHRWQTLAELLAGDNMSGNRGSVTLLPKT